MKRQNPPFRADHVGSLIRPTDLRKARQSWMDGELGIEALRKIEDQSIGDVVTMQERVGLMSVTDGEFRRVSWRDGFFENVDGFSEQRQGTSFEFRLKDGGRTPTATVPAVVGKLKRCSGIATSEFDFLKNIARSTPKATLPAPSVMHFFRGDAVFDSAVYSSADQYLADVSSIYREEIVDLAKMGCTYLQLDEVALPVMCDPDIQQTISSRGEDFNRLIDLYIDAINDAIRDRPSDMTVCLHMCRGNIGEGMASGGYETIADRLFSRLRVDGYLMEYDTPRAGDFSPLRYMPDDKVVALGLISTKTTELESTQDVKNRISQAAEVMDLERLCLCPQCGFASAFTTDRLTVEQEEAKLRHLVEMAADVWG